MTVDVFEGWAVTPTGDVAVVWVAADPRWREPVRVYAEHVSSGTPREVAADVRKTRSRTGSNPQVSVVMSQGVETLAIVDGFSRVGLPLSPTPRFWTEAMGVIRVNGLLRRMVPREYGEKAAGPADRPNRRLMIARGCRQLLVGLEAVGWADNRPVLEGAGAGVVRALVAALSVLPPEPLEPADQVAEVVRKHYPGPDSWDRGDEPVSEEEWFARWSKP